MTSQHNYPVAVIGGGSVGLLFATLLADAQIPVVLIQEKEPLLHWQPDSLESRVSAINITTERLLKTVGIDVAIQQNYSPLRQLMVWDNMSGTEIHFDSAQIGKPRFGAIVENRVIIRTLWENLKKYSNVTLLCPHHAIALKQKEKNITLILDNQQHLDAQCLVGADGGHSWLRQQMKVPALEKSFEQNAVIAVIAMEKKHQNTAWQVFLPDGVLAILPLANPHHGAIVWSTATEQAQILMQTNEQDFNRALNLAFGLRLGDLKLLGALQTIPLWMRHAKHYVQERMALIGDAAHTVHPLAGQGINLGLMDAACLAQCMIDAHRHKEDLGALRTLRRYERWRKGENTLFSSVILGLKTIFEKQSPLMVQARHLGLQMTDRCDVIKNEIMRLASGDNGDLPSILR